MKTNIVCALLALFLLSACQEENYGEPPDLRLSPSTYQGTAPLSVTFSLTILEETDYTVDRFEWDFDGDDAVDATTGPDESVVTWTYDAAGTYSPSVRVAYNEAEAWSLQSLEAAQIEDENGNPVMTYTIRVTEP